MWYTKDIQHTLAALATDPQAGLTEAEAHRRREKYGPNHLPAGQKQSLAQLFWSQINSALIYILIAAAVVSAAVGEISDAVIITTVILLNAVVGVIQESKAEKSLDALKQMTTPHALVKRDGETREIESEKLVPGDIVILDAGRFVPADLRLIETANLQIEESALTGESVPVAKVANWQTETEAALGDQKNMAFMTTLTTFGRGVGVVTGTGLETEIGKIAGLLGRSEKEQTPLQKRLADLGRTLGLAALVICTGIFLIGYLQGRDLLDIFLISVSLAVAAIPESLPAIVTVVLALGVQRMIKRHAIIRKLPAVETLGSVNVICSDKTGTLTQNKMTVTHYATPDRNESIDQFDLQNPGCQLLVETLVLCNDATLNGDEQTGDPTEVALLAMGNSLGLDKNKLELEHGRVNEIPFDSERKLMSTVNRYHDGYLVLTKGAIDSLIHRVSAIHKDGPVVAITEQDKDNILWQADQMSAGALRVLGCAYKPVDNPEQSPEQLESDLIFLGLVGMIDPPREEVKAAISQCQGAGIEVVMITGDHRQTALAIGGELGIVQHQGQVITGSELDGLSQDQLQEQARDLRVYARVSPEHKVRIVQAIKARGNIVAMTGDGVNDAPSLKQADIGVAMGITGTDVAKGASDMILTDDNFATIVAAVEEGRNIYRNIKKSILFLLSCNVGELLALFIAILAGWPAPLLAIHILWVNLVTDTLPAIALGIEPGNPDVMRDKPRSPREGLFAGGGGQFIIFNGALIALLTLTAFLVGIAIHTGSSSILAINFKTLPREALTYAQTMAFLVLSISQLVHALNLRHTSKSIFQVGLWGNKLLLAAILLGLLMQVTIVSVPPLAGIFRVTSLTTIDWLWVLGLSLLPLISNEIIKMLRLLRQRNLASYRP